MNNIYISGTGNISKLILNSNNSHVNADKYLLLNHRSQPRDTNSG